MKESGIKIFASFLSLSFAHPIKTNCPRHPMYNFSYFLSRRFKNITYGISSKTFHNCAFLLYPEMFVSYYPEMFDTICLLCLSSPISLAKSGCPQPLHIAKAQITQWQPKERLPQRKSDWFNNTIKFQISEIKQI